ncbi:MAG: hypothetical protein MK101_07155 [Phycisphaerales bacterium]|nr:hypothetical protein [Phycisphaerales bacterium]
MLQSTLLPFIALVLTSGTPMPDPADYAGRQVVSIEIDDPADLHALLDGGMNCLACTPGAGSHPWVVDAVDLATIEAMGLPWQVLVDDLQRFTAERNALRRSVRGGDYYDDYRTLDEANDRLDSLAADFPDLVTPVMLGLSHEGREIRGIVIRAGADNGRPAVLFNGCQHAREWISPMTVMYIGERLLEGYGTDDRITQLLQRLEVVVVPIVNPDGYAHTYAGGGDRYWRKNRRDNGTTCAGVDLNRNWGVDWNGGESTSSDPCSDIYVGPSSMSEPEVQALADYCLGHGNIVAQIDYHAFSELILEPSGYSPVPPPDWDELHGLGVSMREAIADVHGHSYTADTPCNILYCASGTLIDWPYETYGAAAYCIELRPASGGVGGFDPPPSEIRPCAEENLEGALAMLDWFGAAMTLGLPEGAPTVVRTDGPTMFPVRITEIGEQVGAASLHWRGEEGDWSTTALSHDAGELWMASLPAFACADMPEYFIEVESTVGTIMRLPESAPGTVFAATPMSQIDVIYEHDGETDDGWQTAGDAADGQWERGVPVGGGVRGDPPTDFDGSGACWLTDNVSGNSDVDDGTTRLITPSLAIDGEGLELSYARWFSNDFGASPGEDRLMVEWTDDLGVDNWRPLETVGPTGDGTHGGWIEVSHDLAGVDGIPSAGDIWLRFSAEDIGDGSVVEAGVDAVLLQQMICEDKVEPCLGDVDGSGDVGVNDILAVLAAFGSSDPSGDADGDGVVNVDDILVVVAGWGPCG